MTSEETDWNPYKERQVLVFKSSKDEIDSIYIKEIGLVFPDGIGVPDYYQSQRVSAKHTNPKNSLQHRETYIFKISAEAKKLGKPSHIDFDVRLKNTWFFKEKYDLEWLENQPERTVILPYGEFSDVIEINDKGRDDPDIEIDVKTIYWSKSKGYLMLIKYDGTVWELTDIIG
ncbi:hypothetical protein [Roseivirga sp.]|uniref:hypothetical protein n=1 Tax=Roseivirga sp. TaxID=1964215 RepID=UPI003B8CE91B